MADFSIYEKNIDGPATHALLVGVGNYPHLIGGSGSLYPEHGGMRQLSSPPLSVVAMANWLITDFEYPAKQLASVTMLASGDSPVSVTVPGTENKVAVKPPTFANLEKAAKEWKRRGDSSPDNLMLFYFCGHGIANGPDLALVLEDFGKDPDSVLESALDFRRFHLGMERCTARHQCFFVDACRSGDGNIIEAAGYAGRPIFTPTTRRDRALPVRQMPAFFSTFAGEKAQSRTNEISLFTDAVLRAFRGGGADDTNDEWWVDTNQLQKTVQFMMERAHEQGFPSEQMNPVDNMSAFPLHRLEDDPAVPVVIGCRPKELNQSATLKWISGSKSDIRPPDNGDWDTELLEGRYTFSAQVAVGGATPLEKKQTVRPPFRIVILKETQ